MVCTRLQGCLSPQGCLKASTLHVQHNPGSLLYRHHAQITCSLGQLDQQPKHTSKLYAGCCHTGSVMKSRLQVANHQPGHAAMRRLYALPSRAALLPFRFAGIARLAGKQLEPYVSQMVPKLYRLQVSMLLPFETAL